MSTMSSAAKNNEYLPENPPPYTKNDEKSAMATAKCSDGSSTMATTSNNRREEEIQNLMNSVIDERKSGGREPHQHPAERSGINRLLFILLLVFAVLMALSIMVLLALLLLQKPSVVGLLHIPMRKFKRKLDSTEVSAMDAEMTATSRRTQTRQKQEEIAGKQPRQMTTSSGDKSDGNINITLCQQIFASSIGALLTSLVVTPMDVVKIRLQSQVRPWAEAGEYFLFSNSSVFSSSAATFSVNCHGHQLQCEWLNSRPADHFNGTLDAFVKIARNEGLRSLWSGLSPTMLSAIPATVLYFTLYDNLHAFIREQLGQRQRFLVPMLAGCLTHTAVDIAISPLELVRTKMQSERLSYSELKAALQRTIKSDGLRALWRGLGATIARDIPFSAIYWTSYEFATQRLLYALDTRHTNFGISFACGASSGTLAAVLTLPADVVKTHQQITLGQIEQQRRPQSTSMFACARELVRSKGVGALFTGIVPRVARVAPSCAIMIGCYEHFKLVFARQNRNEMLTDEG